MVPSTYWSTLLFFCFDLSQAATINNTFETEILNNILNKSHYDSAIRAIGEDPSNFNSLKIQVQVLVRYINHFDDIKQEVGMQFVLRLWWHDARHSYDHLYQDVPEKAAQLPDYLRMADNSRIWYPDIFIPNGKNSYTHTVLKPNILIRIFKNGTNYFSTRLTAVLYCSMNLQWYPFDKHACPLQFRIYSLNMREAYLVWNPWGAIETIPENTQIPMFQLEKFYPTNTSEITIIGDKSSMLEATLEFRRRISYYVTKTFAPFFLLAFVSMSAFWLERMDARLTLGITTILATATQMNGLGASDPAVAYIKALDIYTSVCQWFVTAAFLESAIVSMMVKKHGNRATFEAALATAGPAKTNWIFDSKPQATLFSVDQEQPRMIMTIWTNLKSWNSKEVDNRKLKASRIDRIARIAFPVSFTLFIGIYFAICLSH